MNSGLAGKVALITGAAGGIGSEMARVLSAEGMKLVLHCRTSAAAAEALRKALPTPSVVVAADLSREEDVQKLFREAVTAYGQIDVLIANAGVWVEKHTPLQDMSLAQWNSTIATNLTSQFLCCREYFRSIQKTQQTDPSIILIGSTAGIYGEAGHSDYAASKAGATYGFMLSLKNELARLARGGRINAICPGWVMTPMAEGALEDPSVLQRVLQTVAMRKVATPKDVAAATLYLASRQLSGHLTGQTITVAGGMEGRVLYQPGEI